MSPKCETFAVRVRGPSPSLTLLTQMFSILNEVGNNSHFRTTSVVVASVGVAAIIYILVAITGYLSYGNAVLGNIVSMCKLIVIRRTARNLLTLSDAPSISSTIAKAAIVVMVMFSYPLQVHPCRASIDAVMKWRPIRQAESPGSSPSRLVSLLPGAKTGAQTRGDGMGETRFAAITTAIIVLSYIVAMTVSSLEMVLAYVGSTGSTSISFILPGLFYYKIASPDSPHHQRLMKEDDDEEEDSVDDDETLLGGGGLKGGLWRKRLLRRASLALAIYGVVVMITCLVTNTLFTVAPH